MLKNLKDNLFFNVCLNGIVGAFVGILAGAILGLFIWFIQIPLNYVNGAYAPCDGKGEPVCGYSYQIPASQTEALGMSFGALIGAVMGSIAALKEKKIKA